MPTDELKLPLSMRGDILVDSQGNSIMVKHSGIKWNNFESIITAANSHLDLTASVSELKHLLEKRRDENADLVAENERMKYWLGCILEMNDAVNNDNAIGMHSGIHIMAQYGLGITKPEEPPNEALTSDEKKG